MGATVKQMSLDVGNGQSVEILTNLGKPMPQPGKDFSRPWSRHRRGAPLHTRGGTSRASASGGTPRIEDITPPSAERGGKSASSRISSHRAAAGRSGGGWRQPAWWWWCEGSDGGAVDLLNAGLITQDEYNAKRTDILNAL